MATSRPPQDSFAAQQRCFDQWRATFNTERPHETLGDTPPAQHYTASPRPLPRRLPLLEYPATAELRRVDGSGVIAWRGAHVFLTTVLRGEYVGVTETAEGEWTIAFGPLTLGTYSHDLLAFTEHLAWTPVPG